MGSPVGDRRVSVRRLYASETGTQISDLPEWFGLDLAPPHRKIMSLPPAVTLHDDHSQVDWMELERLFAAAGLGGRQGDKLRRAFLNSTAACYANCEGHLIGVARVLSDGEYHALVYDLAVHPEHQGRGIGRRIMEHLLRPLRVWRTMLIASADVQPFYQRLGFGPYPDVMARIDWQRLADPGRADT